MTAADVISELDGWAYSGQGKRRAEIEFIGIDEGWMVTLSSPENITGVTGGRLMRLRNTNAMPGLVEVARVALAEDNAYRERNAKQPPAFDILTNERVRELRERHFATGA